jgi:sec-independent protein translocase protein TatA
MLGLENPIHIMFLLVVLLLVFGAKRLPELGRSLGSGMRGFKDSLSGEPSQQAALRPPPLDRAGEHGSPNGEQHASRDHGSSSLEPASAQAPPARRGE